MHPSPSIIGREREQQVLRDHLDAAIDGHGNLVLVSGEAGIGKTTLVDGLAVLAAERDALVLRGGCYDLTTTPPYGPWREAFLDYRTVDGHIPLPGWVGDPTELKSLGSQPAFFEEIRLFLEEIARHRPLIVTLEDLHWSDQASLDLLRTLTRGLATAPILVVVTYRDDEITRRDKLSQLLPTLIRESQALRIHLHPLDSDAIHAIVRSRYDLSAVDTENLVDHLMQRSQGNPFFTSEILFGLEDSHCLRYDNARWTLSDLDQARVPVLLHQLIHDRLMQLTPASRAALQVAAVIGHEVQLDLWRQAASLQELQLDQVIAESVDSHVLEETRDRSALQFRHALVRETLYDSLILNQRRTLHGKVGHELAQTSQPDPDAVAYHFQQAADARAVQWLIRAGWRAERSYAMQMAARLYETASAALDGQPDAARARGWLCFHCAIALRFSDRRRSLAHLEEAGRIATRADDPVLAAHSLAIHGMLRAWGGELRDALAETKAGYQLLDGAAPHHYDDTQRTITGLYPASIYADRSVAVGHPLFRVGALPGVNILAQITLYWMAEAGQFRQVIEMGEPYIAQVEASTNDELTMQGHCRFAYSALATAYDMLGQPETAQLWQRRALAATISAEDHANIIALHVHELLHVLTHRADRLVERASVARAAKSATKVFGVQSSSDLPIRPELIDIFLAYVEGHWDTVRTALTERWSPLGQHHRNGPVWHNILWREQGEPHLAWERIRELFPEGPEMEPASCDFASAVECQRLAITLALDAGDRDRARAWLETHDRWLAWSGAVIGRAEGGVLWARFFRAAGDHQQAHQSATQALADASNPRQPLALLAVHRCLGELDTDIKRFAEAEEHLRRSLALAEACAAPYEQALTLLALARLNTDLGNVDDAWLEIDRVRAICTPLRAVLALQQATAISARLSVRRGQRLYPGGLSPREAEVLGLVAQGLTDAQVAERLFISPRTVGVHLSSLYNKLGVNSRVDATRFAIEHGLDGSGAE